MSQHFDVLGPNAANYVALTPLSFLQRAAHRRSDVVGECNQINAHTMSGW